jgi:hypothetical protein
MLAERSCPDFRDQGAFASANAKSTYLVASPIWMTANLFQETSDFLRRHPESQPTRAVIFDGRNLYDPGLVRELGFAYLAIGR